MKKITKALIATLIAVSTTSTGLMAQNRTYTGPYPLDIIDQYGEGTATYSYIDDYDLGRIYNGPFSLKWNDSWGNCSLSGQYIKDKQDGEWKYHSNGGYDKNRTLTLTFKEGVLNGSSTYSSISNDYGRWVVKINFKEGKIDGPFSITHINRNNQTDGFLKGNVVQNYPAIGWEYKYEKSSIETTFRFLGDDPDSPDKIEIRRFDTRTGSVNKDVVDINREDYNIRKYSEDGLYLGIMPECVDSKFKEIFSQALRQIDRLILRESTERNFSTRLSNQEQHYDSDYCDVLTAQIKDMTPVKPPKPAVSGDDNKVYDLGSIEQDPIFPGGQAALLQYIASQIRYPKEALENGIHGRVIVQFVVTSTGSVGTVKVVRGIDPELDKEAIRVVKSLPKFTPGKINGQPVNCWYTSFPITFKCQN